MRKETDRLTYKQRQREREIHTETDRERENTRRKENKATTQRTVIDVVSKFKLP